MYIIGSGLAGLLCNVVMPNSQILTRESCPKEHHKAILRLRTKRLEDITGIELKKVTVQKAVWYDGKEVAPTIAMSHQYSLKTTGKIRNRSIIDVKNCIRYITPPDLYHQLITMCEKNIIFNAPIDDIWVNGHHVVSTIPMPKLAEQLNTSDPFVFSYAPIYVKTVPIADCDAYCTMYYPDLNEPVYRASLNGNMLIVESMESDFGIEMVLQSLGITNNVIDDEVQSFTQEIGKFTSENHNARKYFILECTLKHNIYALGRLATWRPKVMLDDVIEDIFHIRRMIKNGNYAAQSHIQEN